MGRHGEVRLLLVASLTAAALLGVSQLGAAPPQTGAPAPAGSGLASTFWRVTQLGLKPVLGPPNQPLEPGITFDARTLTFAASGGCTRMTGRYRVTGDAIRITPSSPAVPCPGHSDSDAAFYTALRDARSFRIAGRALELLDAEGRRLVGFEAAPTPRGTGRSDSAR